MRRNRNRVLKLSTSYRNPMVKHEPEPHSKGCLQIAHSRSRQNERQLPKTFGNRL